MELQILHAIQGIHQEWLTEILRFFTTIGESGLVWIVIAIKADMHSEDPEMRSDHDNRHGNHLSCGKFVPEKCDRETPSLCCGHRCDAENSVPFGIFLPFGTHILFCRSGDHFQLLSAGILSLLMAAVIALSRLYCPLSHGYSGRHGTGNIGCSTGSLHSKTSGRPGRCEDRIRQR